MAVRDRLKKQRNKVKSLVRSAKKSYFYKLIELDKSTSTVWKAINEITNKSHKKTNSSTTTISPNIFNSQFLALAETLAQSSGFISDNFACSKSLRDFCNKKLKPNDGFIIPPVTVLDVGKYITMMDNNKSMGDDNINPFLLKLALPYIAEPLTYTFITYLFLTTSSQLP